MIVVDGKLVLFNDLGELILATQSTERFEELARVSVLGGEICWTQPSLSRGRLFVRNQSRAARVFLGDASRLESQHRHRAIATADIPQRAYWDLASVVPGVEPEYAFDLPSDRWVISWFAWCLAIMSAALPTAVSLVVVARCRALPFETRSLVYWALVVIAGCLGATILILRTGDFVFTWPVAVFAAYQPFIDRLSLSRTSLTRRDKMQSAVAGLAFVVSATFLL